MGGGGGGGGGHKGKKRGAQFFFVAKYKWHKIRIPIAPCKSRDSIMLHEDPGNESRKWLPYWPGFITRT